MHLEIATETTDLRKIRLAIVNGMIETKGRAYIWGLAAFGQPGVEKVLEMLNAELSMVMGQMGARTISDIGPQHIGR